MPQQPTAAASAPATGLPRAGRMRRGPLAGRYPAAAGSAAAFYAASELLTDKFLSNPRNGRS